MRTPEWIQIGFSFALVALSFLKPLDRRRRTWIALLAMSALGAILVARFFFSPRISAVVRDWLPVALLLFPYWQAGRFFTRANPRIEQWLAGWDERLFRALKQNRVPELPHLFGSYLELAYLLCYPLVPVGLGVLYLAGKRGAADFYWLVVLIASDLCFFTTVFFPAMPPRSRETSAQQPAPKAAIRRLNLRVLDHASIRAITIPSGHVASTTACALVLIRCVPLAGVVFLALAASIAVGAFVGRYHYALDVILGAVAALVVFVVAVVV